MPDDGISLGLHDLPDEIAEAILDGWKGSGHVVIQAQLDAAEGDWYQLAYLHGSRLRQAANMLDSASISEYKADEAHYDQMARELNEAYGGPIAKTSADFGPEHGHRPGFFE